MYSIRYLQDGGDESSDANEILTMSEMDSRAMLSLAEGSAAREFSEQDIAFVLNDDTVDGNPQGLYPEVKYDGEVVEPVVNAPSFPPVISFSTSSSPSSNLAKKRARKERSIFYLMAHFPGPFLFVVPLLLVLVIVFGWTSNGTVEYDVTRLWASHDGQADRDYASQWRDRGASTSTFAAVATSRDGGNIMTSSRLDEIRRRMEITESTTVRHSLGLW